MPSDQVLGARAGQGRSGASVTPGIGAAVAAMVAWGFSGIFVALTTQPGLVVALERLWLGVPLVLGLLKGTQRRLSWRQFKRTVPGGVFLAGDIAMFFSAVKLTSIAAATVIGALQPALVLIVARPLFGERVRRRELLWTLLALVAVGVVVSGNRGSAPDAGLGDLLATGSLCCWTGYWLVSKRVRMQGASDPSHARGALGSVEYTAGVMLVAPVVMVPITLCSGEHLSFGCPQDWLWIGLMALIPGSAHLLVNWAHRLVDVSVSSVIVAVNPVVAAGAAVPILHQELGVSQLLGGLVAMVAVALIAQHAARADERAPMG